MDYSVTQMYRPVRRRLKRTVHRSPDKDHARRALAVLQLWETGDDVAEVSRRLCAARSSVYRWRGQFEEFGEQGIAPQARRRTDWKASDAPGSTARFRWVKAPTSVELTRLTHTIARRIARFLERQGLLERDAENSYLTSDGADEDPMNQLLGHSITYRIAVGPKPRPQGVYVSNLA